MNRLDKRTYQRNIMLAGAAYLAVAMLISPLAPTTPSLPLKLLFALAPLLPLIYVIWLAVRRIVHSDELEQRTHLIGLGVAAVAASIFSLIGGFLASSRVLALPAAAVVLMGVFPVMLLTYAGVRWWVARQYGSDVVCDDGSDGLPRHLIVLGAGATCAAVLTAWAYLHDAGNFHFQLRLWGGLTAALAVAALFAAVRRRMRRHGRQE